MKPIRVLLALALLPLAGCSTVGGDIKPFAPLVPLTAVPAQSVAVATPDYTAAVAPPPAQSAGAIYRPGPGLRLFQDARAREVGDLLTINLVERTTAKTTVATAITKDSSTAMAAPTLFGAPVTANGIPILDAELGGTRAFNGAGDSAQSNRLEGSVTVTVVQRLVNGNLIVQGQKQMRLNQGDELVQIQGIVRPADIGPDNTVPSSRVGNAQIVYGGRGTMARSNAMGWLGKFFNSPIYPL